ncbi:MAG: DMP19 family protein [Oscillospiraceae bacterium]|nr:DMP19 family protein [Oscillospiraceae bacterium]
MFFRKRAVTIAASVLVSVIVAVAMSGCHANIAVQPSSPSTQPPKITMTNQHVYIGHDEIVSGYPFGIIDPIWWIVSIYDGAEKYNEDLSVFSLPQRYIFAIDWYAAEVYNGGHEQFFYNSTGIVYPDVLQAFKEIGHAEALANFEELLNSIGEPLSLDRAQRMAQLDKLELDFWQFDEAFYDIRDLDEVMMAYILAHETDFYFDGDVTRPNW